MGYKNLIYVAGSDRVASFEELINKVYTVKTTTLTQLV